jgi:hypothetical protein
MRAPKTPHRSSSELFFFGFGQKGRKRVWDPGFGGVLFGVFLFYLAILVIDLEVKEPNAQKLLQVLGKALAPEIGRGLLLVDGGLGSHS